MGPKPDSNLVWAILATLFCCLPFGVAAIVFATKVDSQWYAGDIAGAQRSSRLARNWSLASLAATIGIVILYVLGLSWWTAPQL